MLVRTTPGNPIYNRYGVVSGTASAVQFPTGSALQIRFKADPDNAEDFFIGNESNQLFPLDAGDDTGWILADNLNKFYYSNVSGSAEYLYWWLQV